MDKAEWIKEKNGFVYLQIHIQPRASKNEVVGIYNGALKIRVTSPPVEGAANDLLMRFISKWLELPKSGVEIVSGDKSRHKILKIQGASMAEVSKLIDG